MTHTNLLLHNKKAAHRLVKSESFPMVVPIPIFFVCIYCGRSGIHLTDALVINFLPSTNICLHVRKQQIERTIQSINSCNSMSEVMTQVDIGEIYKERELGRPLEVTNATADYTKISN